MPDQARFASPPKSPACAIRMNSKSQASSRTPEKRGPRVRRSLPAFLALQALKKRTLTNLCGARPQWPADAHGAVDAVVAAAWGWPAEIPVEEVLRE